MRTIPFCAVFVCLLASGGQAVTAPFTLDAGNVTLTNGHAHALVFPGDPGRPAVLWIRARIDRPAGETAGAHALRLSLNGLPVTPQSVKVLNKREVWDRTGATNAPPAAAAPVTLFDPAAGAWYLKGDSDWRPFNDPDPDSAYHTAKDSWRGNRYRARGAFESHFYEYVFELPAERILAENRLDLANRLEENGAGRPVLIDRVRAMPARRKAALASREWEDIVFPWQAPTADSLLGEGRAIRVAATPGTYGPATLCVYAFEDLREVKLESFPLEGPQRIGTNAIALFRVESLTRPALGEAGFIGQIPFAPASEKQDSPELLRPVSDGPVNLKAFRTQRFFIDVKIPDDAVPGVYRGTLAVSDAAGPVGSAPLEVEVYPFKLAAPRQTYWLWRLTWNPLWEPANLAELKSIRDSGFTGMVRENGPTFKMTVSNGTVRVDGTDYRRTLAALREAGMDTTLRHTSVGGMALRAALEAAGVPKLLQARMEALQARFDALSKQKAALSPSERQELATLTTVLKQLEEVKRKGLSSPALFVLRLAAYGDEAVRRELLDTPGMRTLAEIPPPALVDAPPGVTAKGLVAKVAQQVETALRQVKAIADGEKAKLYVFPVDEPDGTPWRRGWTRWLAARAHAAGLEVWATHNSPEIWNPGIDVSAPGEVKISGIYKPQSVVEGRFEGKPAFPVLPQIGRFRAGDRYAYTFRGAIRDVRIYKRALSAEEIIRQAECPAETDLLAFYPLDEGKGTLARDQSGNGRDAVIHGAEWRRDGQGKAFLFFDNPDGAHYVEPPDLGTVAGGAGWTISLRIDGCGNAFGRGYELYHDGGSCVRFKTTEGMPFSGSLGMPPAAGFPTHLTFSVDGRTGVWRGMARSDTLRRWYAKQVKSTYFQVRSMPPDNFRPKTGVLSWAYTGLEEVTAFGYDSNFSHLYSVYPEGGDRFAAKRWFPTLGWRGTREGITDARYLRTLELLYLRRGLDETAARAAVIEALGPIDDPASYGNIYRIPEVYGSFEAFRRHVAGRILAAMKNAK